MLGRDKLVSSCLLPDLRLTSLLKGHQLAAGNRNQALFFLSDSRTDLYVAVSDDSSIAFSEIDDLEAIEPRSCLLERLLEFEEASRLLACEVAEIAQLHGAYIMVMEGVNGDI
jgi:hypothetical protein